MSSSRVAVHSEQQGQVLTSQPNPGIPSQSPPPPQQPPQQPQTTSHPNPGTANGIGARSIPKKKKKKQRTKHKSQSFHHKDKGEALPGQATEIPHDTNHSSGTAALATTNNPINTTQTDSCPAVGTVPTPSPESIELTSDNATPTTTTTNLGTRTAHTDILQPPFQIKPLAPKNTLSPRKQTLMRHKQSDDELNYINELKGTLKSNKTSPSFSPPVASLSNSLTNGSNPNHGTSHTNTNLNMDEKVTLFKYKSSKILVYDDGDSSSYNSNSSGSLLSFGELEIFQLHKGDITYLSCGSSFIYPLLPKLKVLRINFNQFILPLINPERYWKIIINSDEPNVIQVLENTFERIVKYRNLFIKGTATATVDTTASIHSEIKTAINPTLTPHNKLNDKPGNETKIPSTSSPNDFRFPIISHEIPDSPPSAPLSPHNNGLEFNPISPVKPQVPAVVPQLNKKTSSHSITTVMACLDVNPLPVSPNKNLFHPKPKKMAHANANPYQLNSLQEADKSDSSSMDSLLDEYEENITKTKSITYTRSRPPTRPQSITSSVKYSSVNYSRIYPNNNEVEEFPTTSLSEYNRIHNNGTGGGVRSRRSSRSELYTSETNWMEPNFDFQSQTNISVNTNGNVKNNGNLSGNVAVNSNPRIIQKSRSNYSINSNSQLSPSSMSLSHSQSQPQFDLNKTYRNIYKSIAQRNLKSGLDDELNSHRLPTITANVQSEFSGGKKQPQQFSSYHHQQQQKRDRLKPTSSNIDQHQNAYKLGSSEIYELISKKENLNNARIPHSNASTTTSSRTPSAGNIPRSTSFTSRLFGW